MICDHVRVASHKVEHASVSTVEDMHAGLAIQRNVAGRHSTCWKSVSCIRTCSHAQHLSNEIHTNVSLQAGLLASQGMTIGLLRSTTSHVGFMRPMDQRAHQNLLWVPFWLPGAMCAGSSEQTQAELLKQAAAVLAQVYQDLHGTANTSHIHWIQFATHDRTLIDGAVCLVSAHT